MSWNSMLEESENLFNFPELPDSDETDEPEDEVLDFHKGIIRKHLLFLKSYNKILIDVDKFLLSNLT